MKKWLKSLTVFAAIALVLVPCVLFSACSNNNPDTGKEAEVTHPAVGDTYVFEKAEYTGDVSAEQKAGIEANVAEGCKDQKIVIVSKTEVEMYIDADSKAEKMTYTIADGKITVKSGNDEMVFTIKGETFYGDVEVTDGLVVNITYKLSK